jgi:hypothetical protein
VDKNRLSRSALSTNIDTRARRQFFRHLLNTLLAWKSNFHNKGEIGTACTYSNRFALVITKPLRLPSWVPPPGQIKTVSLNTISSFGVNPCASGNFGCFYSGAEGHEGMFDWVGGQYIEGVGLYGKLAAGPGGGHDAYYGNEVYEFDFETRLWTRLMDPYPANKDTPWNDWGEHVGPVNPGDPVQIAAPHSYRQVLGISPSMGGGTHGSTAVMALTAIGRASVGARGAHILSHAPGQRVWKRWGSAQPRGAGWELATPFAIDTLRRRIWGMSQRQASLAGLLMVWFDIDTQTWGHNNNVPFQSPIPWFFGAGYTGMEYCPTLDCLVAVENEMSPATYASPLVYTLSCSNIADGWRNRGYTGWNPARQLARYYNINWCSRFSRMAFYGGRHDNFCHYLTPPARVDGIWQWSTETFGGERPAWARPRLPGGFNRFPWIDSLRCHAWFHGVAGPVQLFRPIGA